MSDVLRLRQLALVAEDRDRIVDELRTVLGVEVAYHDPEIGRLGLHNAVLPVGEQFLEVVAAVAPDAAAERYRARRGGDSGYMVIVQTDDHASRRERVEELGVRVVARFDADGFTDMQLHPADTGGAFLEIDQQDDGGWHPAGPDWRRGVRTEVSRGIVGVELECREPHAVARRWAEILARPLDAGADDAPPTLSLDDATVRFVPAVGEGADGLVGVDVAVADVEALRRRAERAGLSADADGVVVGGVRFRALPEE